MFAPQDLIKGQDFTQFNPQTAAQHNQLVDAATTYTEDGTDNDGVGLLLTTTDSAANVPVVPRPDLTPQGSTRWKRYVWVRRPFAGSTITSCQVYGWNDNAVTDPTLKNWQLIDPSSYITLTSASRTITDGAVTSGSTNFTSTSAGFTSADIGHYVSGTGIPAGTTISSISSSTVVVLSAAATSTVTGGTYTIQYKQGTPLYSALAFAVDTANNAYSTAITANNNTGALQTACLGTTPPSSVSPSLLAQIGNNVTSISTVSGHVDSLYNWISGNKYDYTASVTSGTINFRLTAAENNITALQTSTVDVSRLIPGPKAGDLIRTNAAGTAAEWFDPTATANLVVSSSSTFVLSPGTWLIDCRVASSVTLSGIGTTSLTITSSLGTLVGSTNNAGGTSGNPDTFPFVSYYFGVFVVSGSSNVTFTIVVSAGTVNHYVTICRRLL